MTIWTVETKNINTKGKWQFETAATTQTEAKDIAEMWRESKGGNWRIRKFVYAGSRDVLTKAGRKVAEALK